MPLKINSSFMRLCLFIGYQSGKWSENLYTNVKTFESVKKQTVSKKMPDFKGK